MCSSAVIIWQQCWAELKLFWNLSRLLLLRKKNMCRFSWILEVFGYCKSLLKFLLILVPWNMVQPQKQTANFEIICLWVYVLWQAEREVKVIICSFNHAVGQKLFVILYFHSGDDGRGWESIFVLCSENWTRFFLQQPDDLFSLEIT